MLHLASACRSMTAYLHYLQHTDYQSKATKFNSALPPTNPLRFPNTPCPHGSFPHRLRRVLPARRAIQYADILAQAVDGRLVLLHVNCASLFAPNDLVALGYHQEELTYQTDTAAILYQQAEGLLTKATVEVATDLLPVVAQDLTHRYQPALFVLSQADEDRPAAGPSTPGWNKKSSTAPTPCCTCCSQATSCGSTSAANPANFSGFSFTE